jgi:hypothetical protein
MSDPTPKPRRRSWIGSLLQRPNADVQACWDEARKLIEAMKGRDEQEDLTDEQCEIILCRWLGQVEMYERLWRGQRNVYYLLRVPIIIGATTIPVLASLHVPTGWTAGVGLAVALLTALDSFFQLGRRWQLHRQAATELGFEGWEFISRIDRYGSKPRASAYPLFITEVENLNKRLATNYLDVFRAKPKPDDGQ